jgi:hypothetical protein
MLSELIEGLQIFLKYGDAEWPTHCEHDELWICNVDAEVITQEDRDRLNELGFEYDEDDGSYKSYAFGSA